MEIRSLNQHRDVLIVAFSVVVLDIILRKYFALVYGETQYGFIIFDLIITLIAVLLGKKVASIAGLPIWQVKFESNNKSKKILIAFFLGIIMVAVNIFIWSNFSGDAVTWANFNNIYEPVLISIRAALTEELVFRLLIFSLIVWVLSKIFKSDTVPSIIGIVLSSIFFGLYHQGFYLAFIFGILLCYIYKHNGLISVMIIHFLSDAIPFLLIYLKSIN